MQIIYFEVIMRYLIIKTGGRCSIEVVVDNFQKKERGVNLNRGAINLDLQEEKKVFINFSRLIQFNPG
jgi:hypothetical protein